MLLRVQTSRKLHGMVATPPNKSHYFRALILGALANGISTIRNITPAPDWQKGVAAMRQFGATITESGTSVEIQGLAGHLTTPVSSIDCGNSGILLRFLMGVASGCEGVVTLTGDSSLQTLRPVGPILHGLREWGCLAESVRHDNHAPVQIRGKIQGGSAVVDGSDSQTVSGLLIAAALSSNPCTIIVEHAGEKPWVEMTLAWLRRVGVHVENKDNKYQHYVVPARQIMRSFDCTVPNDWSAALYPLLAALITPQSESTVVGLDPNDVQGDKQVVEILQAMGGDIQFEPQGVVARSSVLHGMEIDCNDFIDQLPLLAVAGTYATGTTRLYNAAIARKKESDRIHVMCEQLQRMGAVIEELPDGLIITGGRQLHGTVIEGYHDHRIVMSLAVAGLQAAGTTTISDAEMIAKTFADFVPQMQGTGACMDIIKS